MTNFVFSRRSLQTSINDLAGVIEQDQLADLVHKLNKVYAGRMAVMWEVAVLSALAKIGSLSHESPLSDGSRPDFCLSAQIGTLDDVVIVGDVTNISDDALHEQNPVEEFAAQLIRIARKVHLRAECIGYRVGSQRANNGRLGLCLPKKGDIAHLLKTEVQPWMLQRAALPNLPGTFSYEHGAVNFSITYEPRQRSFNGGHLVYTGVTSLNRNTLAHALKRKSDQLQHAPATAIRMIIACDGGASIFHELMHARSAGRFTAYEISQDFLRQTSTVDVVLLITVDQPGIFLSTPCKINWSVVMRPRASWPDRISRLDVGAFENFLDRFINGLPRPIRTPSNAAQLCKSSATGLCPFGGYEMSSNRIKLSARALQQLLSGEVSVDEFCDRHGWGETTDRLPNPFKQFLLHGRPIAEVEVQPGGDSDDIGITFTFGPPDPALIPFRVPKVTS